MFVVELDQMTVRTSRLALTAEMIQFTSVRDCVLFETFLLLADEALMKMHFLNLPVNPTRRFLAGSICLPRWLFGLKLVQRFCHGLANQVIGFCVGIPVIRLSGGALIGGSIKWFGLDKGDVAFEFFLVSNCLLRGHQRDGSRVFFLIAAHSCFGDHKR